MRESVILCICVILLSFGNVFPRRIMWTPPVTISTPSYNKEISQKHNESHVAEIKYLHITSKIRDHFKKTDILAYLENDDNKQKEVQFSFLLPEKDSFVEKLDLETFWWDDGSMQDGHNKTIRNDKPALTKQVYRDLVSQQGISVALLEKDPNDPERYIVHVNLPAKTECAVKVVTAEILPMQSNEFNIVTKFQTNLEVKKLDYIVFIDDNRPIESITISGPKTEQTKNSDTLLENANILREFGPRNAIVIFSPDQNQIRQIIRGSERKETFSTNGIDFVIHYQIDRQPSMPDQFQNPFENDYGSRVPIRPLSESGISPIEFEKVKTVKELLESKPGQVDSHLVERLKNLRLVTSVTSSLFAERRIERKNVSPTAAARPSFPNTTPRRPVMISKFMRLG